jgi:hypothetical protein
MGVPGRHMRIRKIIDLETHPDSCVTASALADYWRVSREQILKQVDAGALPALRLSPRTLSIRTVDAIRFEDAAMMKPSSERKTPSRRRSHCKAALVLTSSRH